MITRNFPVLTIPLDESLYLGILVGTDKKIIAASKELALQKLEKELQGLYRKTGEYPDAYFRKVKLKSISIGIHPSFRIDRSLYPLSNKIKVPVWAVFGEVSNTYKECVLPFLGAIFRYQSENRLDPLISHYASYYLNEMSPEELFQIKMMSRPKLDVIHLKVKENRSVRGKNKSLFHQELKVLPKVATPYPSLKKKTKSIIPDVAWNRMTLMNTLIQEIITSKSSILLVGECGVGKSALLRATIRRIKTESKKTRMGISFWSLMPDALLYSGKYLGDWQENTMQLIDDLRSVNGVLWVEQIVELLTAGGETVNDSLAAFFLPYLKSRNLQMIAEVSPQALSFIRTNFPDFIQLFRIIRVDEMNEVLLRNLFDKYCDYTLQNHQVKIDLAASQIAYRLLDKYYSHEAFPGKMITFLGDCVSRAIDNKMGVVDRMLVYEEFSKKSGLQPVFIRDDLKMDTRALREYFTKRIIGQPVAVGKCISLVKIFKTGLNNPSKPIHVMLFAGPTGVGKTETTKVLARYFFGGEKGKIPLIQFDMSEFQYPEQITRLIGTDKKPGKLVEKVKEMPFTVLLFDEIEKANPAIFNTLLTIFDEGKLMDARGNTVNFKNTIIVMTSNIGVTDKGRPSFVQDDNQHQQYASAIRQFFKPEFVNRIDEIVLFNKLTKNDLRQIVRLELNKINKREGLIARNISIDAAPSLIEKIVEDGFDSSLGARPIKRAIEQLVVVQLSRWLIAKPDVSNLTLRLSFPHYKLVIEEIEIS